MRLSFMTFACPTWPLEQVLAEAARLGYDGVEPRLDSGHAHGLEVALDAAGRADAKARAADAGIELCCLATSLQFIATDDVRRADLLRSSLERIALAADLGVPGLRVFAGGVPAGVALDAALDAASENLRAVGAVAADQGVELWLETHDTLCRGELCGRVVRAADHPAVKVNYDVIHPLRLGEELEATWTALDGLVRHAHWHDAMLDAKTCTITRFGEGETPLPAILRHLAATGYDGYLSGEWFDTQLGETPEESLTHYVEATRALLAQV